MADISLSFDTVTKAGKVTIDGTEVADLSEFHLYHAGRDQFGVEIYSRKEDKSNGTYTSTRVCADAGGNLVQAETAQPVVIVPSPEPPKVEPVPEAVLNDIKNRYK